MESDLPAEVLAWIFLFVRGPPSSGALSESRLVCKRWREIIDAHLKRSPTSKLYATAYRLGYLSPANIFPDIAGNILLDRLQELLCDAAKAHAGALFKWTRDFAVRRPELLPPDTEMHLNVMGRAPSLQVASGLLWDDGLTVEEIQKECDNLHPLDMRRARDKGVVITVAALRRIARNGSFEESEYGDWTAEEVEDMFRKFSRDYNPQQFFSHARPAVPWLLRRGVINAANGVTWFDALTSGGSPQHLAMAMQILDAAETGGWLSAIIEACVKCVVAGDCGWSVIQSVVQRCPEELRARLWYEDAALKREQHLRKGFIDPLVRRFTGETTPTIGEVLDWLREQGMFQNATLEQSRDMVWQLNAYRYHVTAMALTWFANHLSLPEADARRAIITTVLNLGVPPDHLLWALVSPEDELRWRLIRILIQDWYKHEVADVTARFRAVFAAGYRLPAVLDITYASGNDTDRYWRTWPLVLAVASEFGQPVTNTTFSAGTISLARRDAKSVPGCFVFLEYLEAQGVEGPRTIPGVARSKTKRGKK